MSRLNFTGRLLPAFLVLLALLACKNDNPYSRNDNLYTVENRNHTLYMDATGRVVSDGWDAGRDYQDGFAAVGRLTDMDGERIMLWGFINIRGEQVVDCKFPAIGSFSQGLAPAATFTPNSHRLIWGYIDSTGEYIIPARFVSAAEFSEDLAAVGTSNDSTGVKFGFINKMGEVIIKPQFDVAEAGFTNGLCLVGDIDVQPGQAEDEDPVNYFFVNKNGERAFDGQYDDAAPYSDGMALVMQDGMFGFLDATGHLAVEARFTDAGTFNKGLAPATENDVQWGYIDKQGNWIIAPGFAQALPFNDQNLAPVQVGGLWGYINMNGEMIIKPSYMEAWPFSGRLAAVRLNGRDDYVYIDTKGTVISPAE